MQKSLGASFRDYRHCWKHLFLVGICYQLISFILLTPLVSILFRIFVAASGKTLLADQDILFFFMAPLGWVCLITVGALWLGILALQLAAMMSIVADPSPVGGHTLAALRFATSQAWRTIQITARITVFAVLTSVPFLVVMAVIYFSLLSDSDINFYLTHKPPIFYVALGMGLFVMVVFMAVLLRFLAGWVCALPIVLFENVSPRQAMGLSRGRATGQRRRIVGWLLGWLLATTVLSAIATSGVIWLSSHLIPFVNDSLRLLTLTIGLSLVAWSIVNLIVGLFSTTTLATLIFNLYRSLRRDADFDVATLSWSESTGDNIGFQITNKRLLAGCCVGLALALFTGYFVLQSVSMEDNVDVIAHRGASQSAPENTLAAIHQAIDDGTDWVEIDVQEIVDGTVVVFHDSDFMKQAGMRLKIWDATMEELSNIDIGSWFAPQFKDERVPTLAQVLDACKDKVGLYIELKYYGHDVQLEQKVVDLVETHGMTDDVVIISLKVDAIKKIKSLRPTWKTGLLMSVSAGNLAKLDTDFLAVNASFASRNFIRRANRVGKEVCAWTVNDPVGMSTMIGRGVRGVITDKPALARSVLEQRAEMSAPERLILELAGILGIVPEIGEQ